MGFSAFLALPMARENKKDKKELRPVDEEADAKVRFVRLGKDAVEEVEELPPVRVGDSSNSDVTLLPASKDELKIRSMEPDVGSLIEKEAPVDEEVWDSEDAPDRNFPWGWVALVSCVFSVAILWSLSNLNNAGEKSDLLEMETSAILQKERQEEIDAEMQIGTIEKAVRNFLDSRSVEEMLRYVRHPERVRPLMESYYAAATPKPVHIENFLSLEPLTIDNRASFWMISCQLEGELRTQMMLELNSVNDAKVDWETFVCYQPMAWDEFANSRPSGYTGDFRVYVEKDMFHSHEFSDSNTFDSYRLTALNGEEVLFGYVPHGRGLGLKMQELTAGREGESLPMLLRLHIPKELKSPRGVVIKEIVSPRWFFADDPKEGEP